MRRPERRAGRRDGPENKADDSDATPALLHDVRVDESQIDRSVQIAGVAASICRPCAGARGGSRRSSRLARCNLDRDPRRQTQG
jgi:hypothetical protein